MEEMLLQCTQMMSQMNGMMGGGMMGGGMMGGMPIAGWASPWYWLGWVLVFGLLVSMIGTIVWIFRSARRPAERLETSLSILQRRLARGDVSPEQFDTIKRQLSAD